MLWDRTVEKEIGNVCNCMVNPQNVEQYEFPDPQACIQETLGEKVVCPAVADSTASSFMIWLNVFNFILPSMQPE